MKTALLDLPAERNELLSRPYHPRHTKYDANELFTGPVFQTNSCRKKAIVLNASQLKNHG